jgi:sirohydrochlorin ferrochelatase
MDDGTGGPGGAAAPVLVACAHGTRDPRGRRAVEVFVDAVRRAVDAVRREAGWLPAGSGGAEVEVYAAYVDVQDPTPAQVLAAVSGCPAVLVPVLLSTGYHVQVDLPRAARQAAGPTVVAAPLGPDDRLARLVADGCARLGVEPGDDVRLVAAGSSRPAGLADVAEMARRLAAARGDAVRPAYLSAGEPRLADVVAANRAEGRRTVAASYLLAPGFFQDRLEAAGAEVATGPLLDPDAEPPADLVAIVLDRYRAAAGAMGVDGPS